MKGQSKTAMLGELPRGGWLMRLRGLVRKEFLQILRDPSSIAIAFVMPVVLLLLFGYGLSLDAEHVPLAVVIEEPSADASAFIGSFQHSRYFDLVLLSNMHQAEQEVRAHRVQGIIYLRENFARQRRSTGAAPVQVLLNGVDANTARLVQGYVNGAWEKWLEWEARSNAEPLTMPVQVSERVWFNSELRSRDFLVPGLIAVIMTLIGALLTAMVMAREWERGTMEALLVTPVAIHEVLLGKLIPYFILGTGGLILSVVAAVWLFDIPLRGSLVVLFAASSLFLLAALGMGLLISILAKNQFVAGQVAIIVTFLPAFILSGFIFDIDSMPRPIQVITHLIPARYLVTILQTAFLAGDVPEVILPNGVALLLMAAFFLGLSRWKSHKRLE